MSDQVIEKISDKTPDHPLGSLASPTLKQLGKQSAPEIELDPALIAELCEVTNDPSQAVNNAIRQWLQRRAIKEADSSRPLAMNPIVPPRGEWND